jgi:SAM-dependent methyltransferase
VGAAFGGSVTDPKPLFYPESRFGGFSDVDGTVLFYSRVNALLERSSVVVDIGCGRGVHAGDDSAYRRSLRDFRGKAARVIGIDVDPAGASNPLVDEFRPIETSRWPLETRSVDLCVADYVLEHVPDPETFFSELARVLKPGGVFAMRTTNAWGYPALVARVVPLRFHAAIVSKVQSVRKTVDVFPTLYRCNTVPKIRRTLARRGFQHVVYGYDAEPAYFAFSRWVYAAGVAYHKSLPHFCHYLRGSIFAFARLSQS